MRTKTVRSPIMKGLAVLSLMVSALAASATMSQAQQGQARVTVDLNQRSGPSTAYGVVQVLPAGAIVDVYDCTAARTWCQVSYQNRLGWTSASYLQFGAAPVVTTPPPQPQPPAQQPPLAGQVQARATVDLNMRSGPSTQYGVVGSIPRGGVATLSRCTDGYVWCEATYNGRTGWAAARYLEAVSPQYGQQPINNVGRQLGLQLFNFILGQIGGQVQPTPVPTQPRTPGPNEVCFYRDAGFAGEALCIRMGQSDAGLASAWNDTITSLRVGQGAWVEVCANPGFTGTCRTYAENISQLPNILDDRISSYRTNLATPGPAPIAQACFYADFDFQGPSFCLSRNQDLANLGPDWNDRISSIRVDAGLAVQICEANNFAGWCEQYNGNIARLSPTRNDGASSIRVR